MKNIRWGIIGCGGIAHSFARDLALCKGVTLQAVASRDASRAKKFAAKYSAEEYHSSYEDLLANPKVDAVYLATPHSHHAQQAEMILKAGKALFCEKPMTVNADQTRRLIALAENRKVFIAEAFWTAYFPAVIALQELIASGVLGKLLHIEATHHQNLPDDPQRRWVNPELAGGALLDLGVYPVGFAMLMTGETAAASSSVVRMGETGVDVHEAMLMDFPGGATASLSSGMLYAHPKVARLIFEGGGVFVPDFLHPDSFIVYPAPGVSTDNLPGKDQAEEIENIHGDDAGPAYYFDFPGEGGGYEYEIQAVSDMLREGATSSQRYPAEQSLKVMEQLDAFRAQWNFIYPFERQ